MKGASIDEIKKMEKREWQLWILMIVIFLACVVFIFLMCFYREIPGDGLDIYTTTVLVIGFVALSLLFCAHAVFTERTIKILRRKIIEGERKRIVELMEAYYELESIIKNIGDSVIVTDLEGNIKEVNESTCTLLGYMRKELINESGSMLFKEGSRLFARGMWRKLVVEGYLRSRELTYLTKYGDEIPVLFSASMRLDQNNLPIGMIGVAHDLREMEKLKQLEEDLELAIRKLEMVPKYSLGKGQTYIIKDEAYSKCYSVFEEQLLYNVQGGLCLTKFDPQKVKEKYKFLKVSTIFQITSKEGINAIPPKNLAAIEMKISNFVSEISPSIVLLDCLDEIKLANGWYKSIIWIRLIKDICKKNKAILLLSIRSAEFEADQLTMIEKEAELIS